MKSPDGVFRGFIVLNGPQTVQAIHFVMVSTLLLLRSVGAGAPPSTSILSAIFSVKLISTIVWVSGAENFRFPCVLAGIGFFDFHTPTRQKSIARVATMTRASGAITLLSSLLLTRTTGDNVTATDPRMIWTGRYQPQNDSSVIAEWEGVTVMFGIDSGASSVYAYVVDENAQGNRYDLYISDGQTQPAPPNHSGKWFKYGSFTTSSGVSKYVVASGNHLKASPATIKIQMSKTACLHVNSRRQIGLRDGSHQSAAMLMTVL